MYSVNTLHVIIVCYQKMPPSIKLEINSNIYVYICSSITTPQDAHKRLVLQVYLCYIQVHCYFTRPEQKALEMRVLYCKLTRSKALYIYIEREREFKVLWLL